MTRSLAIAILVTAACYERPATNAAPSTESSTSDGTTTDDPDSSTTTDDPSTSSADTQIDPDTRGSSTGPAECELGRFDQSAFDAACFAP